MDLLFNQSTLLLTLVKFKKHFPPEPLIQFDDPLPKRISGKSDLGLCSPYIAVAQDLLQRLVYLVAGNVLDKAKFLITFILQAFGKEGYISIEMQINLDTIHY